MKTIGMLALLLCLCGCSKMLFYPERGLPFTPEKARLSYRDLTLTAADGTRLHAWWLPAREGVPVKGTVLHLHGNGGNLASHLGATWWLPAQGYQVLMLDYRGYGLSEGEPSLPALYQDLDAAFAWLDSAPQTRGSADQPAPPRIVLGQSIGGALAVHYLAAHPEHRSGLKALILDGAPASYRDVARHVLAGSWLTWALQYPLSWFIPDGDSAQHSIAQLKGTPILLFHSLDDQVVPLESGLTLYKAAALPRMLQLTRGGHVQTFASEAWRQLLLDYLGDPCLGDPCPGDPQHFTGLRRLDEMPGDEPRTSGAAQILH